MPPFTNQFISSVELKKYKEKENIIFQPLKNTPFCLGKSVYSSHVVDLVLSIFCVENIEGFQKLKSRLILSTNSFQI